MAEALSTRMGRSGFLLTFAGGVAIGEVLRWLAREMGSELLFGTLGDRIRAEVGSVSTPDTAASVLSILELLTPPALGIAIAAVIAWRFYESGRQAVSATGSIFHPPTVTHHDPPDLRTRGLIDPKDASKRRELFDLTQGCVGVTQARLDYVTRAIAGVDDIARWQGKLRGQTIEATNVLSFDTSPLSFTQRIALQEFRTEAGNLKSVINTSAENRASFSPTHLAQLYRWAIVKFAKALNELSTALYEGGTELRLVQIPELPVPNLPLLNLSSRHDWTLPEAYEHWACATNKTGDFIHDLEQAASEGGVTIWGRRNFMNTAILEEIPRSHWALSKIERHGVLFSSPDGVPEQYILENSRTAPRNKRDLTHTQFWHLKVTSSEIKRLWPPASQ